MLSLQIQKGRGYRVDQNYNGTVLHIEPSYAQSQTGTFGYIIRAAVINHSTVGAGYITCQDIKDSSQADSGDTYTVLLPFTLMPGAYFASVGGTAGSVTIANDPHGGGFCQLFQQDAFHSRAERQARNRRFIGPPYYNVSEVGGWSALNTNSGQRAAIYVAKIKEASEGSRYGWFVKSDGTLTQNHLDIPVPVGQDESTVLKAASVKGIDLNWSGRTWVARLHDYAICQDDLVHWATFYAGNIT